MYVLTPTVGLFGGHLRVAAVFDRQTGFVIFDQFAQDCRFSALCLAPFVATTPLLQQAPYADPQQEDFLQSGDFTRWRELTLSVDLPAPWLRAVRMSQGSLSLQARNLALWTDYRGSDPESRSGRGLIGADVRGVPQARAWSVRFDFTP
jgi:hypothetical protein